MKVLKKFGWRRVLIVLALTALIGTLALGNSHNGLARKNYFNGAVRASALGANAKAGMFLTVRLNPNDISN